MRRRAVARVARGARYGAVTIGVTCAMAYGARAWGQRVATNQARTIVVGAPLGASPAERVDAARSGASRAPLPTGTLHVAWRRSLGFALDSEPLVSARGEVVVVAASGKVVVLAPDGEERSHTVVGAAATSGAALTSDGTVVFMTSQGDAVGVHLGAVRFRTRLGGGRSMVAPLALDDGGLVVATPAELVSLDGEGNVRARVAVDAGTAPVALLGARRSARGGEPRVYEVFALTGDVYEWVPASGREPSRIGTFGGSVDGGAALTRDGSILAVVDGARLVALDPAHGTPTIRASTATTGALAFLGPPATHDGSIALLALTASRTVAIAFDASGAESLRQSIAPSPLPPLPDGGFARGVLPAHVGPLVDPQGDIAFALPSGEVGSVAPSGSVDVVNDVCARFSNSSALAALGVRQSSTFAGIAPAAPSAMIVACGSGVVARVDNDFAHVP
jgi:hypothetical protein